LDSGFFARSANGKGSTCLVRALLHLGLGAKSCGKEVDDYGMDRQVDFNEQKAKVRLFIRAERTARNVLRCISQVSWAAVFKSLNEVTGGHLRDRAGKKGPAHVNVTRV